MKKILAVLLLVLALGIVNGCGPKRSSTERSARRLEQHQRTVQRDSEALPEDLETFWLTNEPGHLNRWDGH